MINLKSCRESESAVESFVVSSGCLSWLPASRTARRAQAESGPTRAWRSGPDPVSEWLGQSRWQGRALPRRLRLPGVRHADAATRTAGVLWLKAPCHPAAASRTVLARRRRVTAYRYRDGAGRWLPGPGAWMPGLRCPGRPGAQCLRVPARAMGARAARAGPEWGWERSRRERFHSRLIDRDRGLEREMPVPRIAAWEIIVWRGAEGLGGIGRETAVDRRYRPQSQVSPSPPWRVTLLRD